MAAPGALNKRVFLLCVPGSNLPGCSNGRILCCQEPFSWNDPQTNDGKLGPEASDPTLKTGLTLQSLTRHRSSMKESS